MESINEHVPNNNNLVGMIFPRAISFIIPRFIPPFLSGSIFEGASQSTSPAISLESLSLDELNLSDVNEPGHTRYSQPRVRNKSVC